MIKAVIFDMFETLVSLFEGRTFFSEDMAQAAGTDPETFRAVWHGTEHDRSTGRITVEEGIAVTLRTLGLYSEEKVKEIAAGRQAALADTFAAIPLASVKLLEELRARGILIGLISNAYYDERDFIRGCALFPFFDAVRISCEQGVCKPDPDMYLSVMEELDVQACECLYVGDGGSRELFTAEALGMKAVQAVWFRDRAFAPHVPCPLFEEFPHAACQGDIPDLLYQ